MFYSDSICLWIVCVCVNTSYDMMQSLVPWEIICQPQALDTVLEGADPAWLFLDSFSYLPQQFPLLAEAITKCISVVFLFFGGNGNIFLGLYSYIMLSTRFRKTTTQYVWIYSQSCVTITPISFTVFLLSQKETSFSVLQSLLNHSQALTYSFACSGPFKYMESHNICPFVTDFFP